MHPPDSAEPPVPLLCSMMVAAALAGCHRPGQDTRSIAVRPDSAQLVQLAIAEFRRAASDSGPMLVSQFVASGDSVIIVLAPDEPPGTMTFRGGGRFIVRGGVVVAAQVWQ